MASKMLFAMLTAAAVVVGLILPSPHQTGFRRPLSQIAQLDIAR